jgi:CBS domain-containing protein
MKVMHILATKGAEVITIRSEQSLKAGVDLLSKHNIGALIVVDQANQVVGIISERDIIREAARREDFLSRPVGEVMTRDVITGLPQDDVKSVLQTMSEKKIRHLPVIDRGKLAGMISIRDVVQAQLNEYEGEIDTLEARIIESGEAG